MAEPRRPARGEDWQQRRDRAQQAWLAANQALAALVGENVPPPVRDGITALGDLLWIWRGYGEDRPMADVEQAVAPLVFDWHAENKIDRDSLLAWLIPTATRSKDMDRVSALTGRFTRCELRIVLNGVDLDARAFLDGVARSIERAARDESASLAETAGFGDIEDAVRLVRAAVRAEMLGRLRAAGVPIRDEED